VRQLAVAAHESAAHPTDAARAHQRECAHESAARNPVRLSFPLDRNEHERAALPRLAHDDLARVDSDPQRQSPAEGIGQATLHRKRCMQRPLGVVLLRGRRAEGGHHRVANELLNRATRARNLQRHRVVEAVEQCARPLGVLPVGELGRTGEVGEEHRRELALVSWRGRRNGCGADGAEPRAACELGATNGTCPHE
jgi:hypothetical protein